MSHHPSPDEPPSAPPLPNRFFLQHHRSLSTSIFSAMSSRGCCRSRSGNGNGSGNGSGGLCGLHLHDLFFSSRRSSYNSPPKDDDDDDDRDEAMEEAPSDQAPVSSWPDLWPRFGSTRRMNLMKDEDRFLVDHDLNGGGGEDLNYVRPPRWKLFFRKLRSETKKMNCGSRPSGPGFQYDAVSYAMNFDDGSVWKQQQQMQQQQAFLNSATSGGDKGFS